MSGEYERRVLLSWILLVLEMDENFRHLLFNLLPKVLYIWTVVPLEAKRQMVIGCSERKRNASVVELHISTVVYPRYFIVSL